MSSDIDIGQITEALNDKMDRDGVNAECPTLLSRTPNNQGGVVEIWSDGYCVQTGIALKNSNSITITFSQNYNNNTYLITISQSWYGRQSSLSNADSIYEKALSYFSIYSDNKAPDYYIHWRAEGYIR